MIRQKLRSGGGDWVEELRKVVETPPGMHKPVLDLFTKDANQARKFDLLAKHNPGVLHVYVGHNLDGSYRPGDEYVASEWDPDELLRPIFQDELEDRRRLYSSRDVSGLLEVLPDESINRVNIDMGIIGVEYMMDCVAQCMRVLEPGGAIEFATLEQDREELNEIGDNLGIILREVEPTPLDFHSTMLSAHHFKSSRGPEDAAIKFIIEKQGGGDEVDKRTFWERIPAEEQERLGYTV